MENRYTTDFEFQSQVQAALSGDLDTIQKTALFTMIAKDVEAKSEFVFSERLAKTLRYQNTFAVAGLVGQIIDEEGLPDTDDNDDLPNENPVAAPPRYSTPEKAVSGFRNWVIGAVVVLFVGAGIFGGLQWQATQKAEKAAKIAFDFVKPLENDLFTFSPLQGLDDLKQGMAAYNGKDYPTAISLLGRYYRSSKDANAGLYLAVSILMSNGDTGEAERVLNEILPQFAPPISQVSEWYLTLAKLKNGKRAEALMLLRNVKSDSPYRAEASELLYKLGKEDLIEDN
jgi:tetratricopeptide (TPR) repeat protein